MVSKPSMAAWLAIGPAVAVWRGRACAWKSGPGGYEEIGRIAGRARSAIASCWLAQVWGGGRRGREDARKAGVVWRGRSSSQSSVSRDT